MRTPRFCLVVFAAAAASCSERNTPIGPEPTFIAPPTAPAVFVGAGDIGDCAADGASRTAQLLDRISGTVFTAGDNAYPVGSTTDYGRCYDPYWGRHAFRTRPTPGNHEYLSANAAPYFAYFGDSAGPAGRGYYSFNLGAWHIVSLNSNVPATAGSPQLAWLEADLATAPVPCTLAYWHHPRFSSGFHGNHPIFTDLWRLLDRAGADVVITGHDHHYERFAPQTADGVYDPAGIRSFVAGTGGHGELRALSVIRSNSQVRAVNVWGVLKMTLHSTRYDWEFVPVAGSTFSDVGSADCVK